MSLKIDIYKNQIPLFDDIEYENAIKELSSHMQNKSYFLHSRQIEYSGVTINGNYSTKNLNQSIFYNCIFENCNLQETGFSRSTFKKAVFKECLLNSAVFHNCYFYDCTFENIESFIGARFGKSLLINTTFSNCIINSASFDDAYFENCVIENSMLKSLSLDNCTLKSTYFDNVKFRNMNLDFSIFMNIRFNKTKIPFPTIPYIIGGLDYLMNTNDDVMITSQINKIEGITKNNYLSQLNNFEIFFATSKNYYPLVNIYASKKSNNKACSAIVNGIHHSLLNKEFNMIKNYALQVKYYNLFSINERKKIVDLLLKAMHMIKTEPLELEILNTSIMQTRNILLNTGYDCNLQLTIKTKVNDRIKLGLLISSIEKLVNAFDNNNNFSIEIRHNSPYDLFLNLFNEPAKVACILGLIYYAYRGSKSIISDLYEIMSSKSTRLKDAIEREMLKNELKYQQESKELDIALKRLELQKAQKIADNINREMKENEVLTSAISYTIINAPVYFYFIPPYDITED